eukprot:7390075-Prymnesium_polylepis.1
MSSPAAGQKAISTFSLTASKCYIIWGHDPVTRGLEPRRALVSCAAVRTGDVSAKPSTGVSEGRGPA